VRPGHGPALAPLNEGRVESLPKTAARKRRLYVAQEVEI
jgi:hypothetical protein